MGSTIDYKTVFQLAQDKGYKLKYPQYNLEIYDIYLNAYLAVATDINFQTLEDARVNFEKNNYYAEANGFLELTIIQKWLRDEHNLDVLVMPVKYTEYGYQIRPANSVRDKYKTYEEALLNGINESLKLI